jgi:hypothetical protein
MKVGTFNFRDKEKTLRAQRLYPVSGAKDGVRTRDLDLGKVALYQLSYFRVFVIATRCCVLMMQMYATSDYCQALWVKKIYLFLFFLNLRGIFLSLPPS